MKPPVPGTRTAPIQPLVKTHCRIHWPDGAEMTADQEASYPGETSDVRWTGAVDKLKQPMPHQAGACELRAFLQHQADITGGAFATKQDGLWPAMDEVKA